MFELLLLIPFAAAAAVGIRQYIAYRLDLRETGIEVPLALFSNKPPGEIRMHDWSQRQLEAKDPRRAEAIKIGQAELADPNPKQWEKAYHRLLLDQGAPMIETGDSYMYNGREFREYMLEGCDCDACDRAERVLLKVDIRTRKMLG